MNEITSVGRNIEVVLGYGKRGSRSGGSLPSEHSLAFRDGAGTIHERRQSYERRTSGDEGVAGTRGREPGLVNADDQCNLLVFRTELDGTSSMLRACFAGTPIVVNHDGQSIAIEQLRPGDWIHSRSEHNPNGSLELKHVQEVFVRTGKIFALTVDGRVINTTGYLLNTSNDCSARASGDELVLNTGRTPAKALCHFGHESGTVADFFLAPLNKYCDFQNLRVKSAISATISG